METTLRNTSLGRMFTQLQEQNSKKMDLVVPSTHLTMHSGQLFINDLTPEILGIEDGEDAEAKLYRLLAEAGIDGGRSIVFNPIENAENQISHKLKIPRNFYKYLKSEHVDLLDHNVTELFERAEKNYFVRTFKGNGNDGIVRALLSDQYKVIDHLDVLGTTLDVIKEMGVAVEVGRCNLTLDNMYVEIISKDVIEHADDLLENYRSPRGRNNDGDNRIFAGFVIGNSETGRGRYRVQPRAMVGKCSNGLIFKKDALAATHLGSKMESGIQWSADTMATEVSLVQKQTRDAVKTFLSREYLGRKVDELRGFTKPLDKPMEAINNVCKSLNFSEERVQDVVNHFVQGGDSSSLGVANALTFYAQEVEEADMQYEVEEQAVELLPEIERFGMN